VDIELRLREALLPVFGLESIEEIPPEASLVRDIGADSLDFVEITYIIENDFGVTLKTGELLAIGVGATAEDHFSDGRLTAEGAAALNARFPGENRFAAGMTKIALFESISTRDLARLIARSQQQQAAPC
jgi:acyl carrier protein